MNAARCLACGRLKGLDLFGCMGGAGRGYQLAGFCMDAVDLDANALRRYPVDCIGSQVIEADAIEYVKAEGHRYAFRHASPPCQFYSTSRHTHSNEHPDLIGPTRDALVGVGGPYVIENVTGARPYLDNPVELCGASFGLTAVDHDGTRLYLRRHRLFESNVWLFADECSCAVYRDRGYWCGGAYGGTSRTRESARYDRQGGYVPPLDVQKQLLGIDWMTRHGLAQSIPPAYTKWLGEQIADRIDPW